MLKRTNFTDNITEIFSNLQSIPEGDAKASLADLKQRNGAHERRTALKQLRSMCLWWESHAELANVTESDFIQLCELYWQKAPSLEFKRLTTEALLHHSRTSKRASLIDFCRSQIQTSASNVKLESTSDVQRFIQQQYQAPIGDQTALYWLYISSSAEIRQIIHEYLYDIPFEYPYFRLVRWLFSYAEVFRQYELLAILSFRFYNEEETLGKAWSNGTPTSLRRRVRRSFDLLSNDDQYQGLLEIIANTRLKNSLALEAVPPLNFISQLIVNKPSPRNLRAISSIFRSSVEWLYGLNASNYASVKNLQTKWNDNVEALIAVAKQSTSADIHEFVLRVLANLPTADIAKHFEAICDLSCTYYGYGILALDLSQSLQKSIEDDWAIQHINAAFTHKNMYFWPHMHAIGRFIDAHPNIDGKVNHNLLISLGLSHNSKCIDDINLPKSIRRIFARNTFENLFVLNLSDALLCHIAEPLIGSHYNIIPSSDTLERMATRHLRRNSKDVHQKVERLLQIVTSQLDAKYYPKARLVYLLSQSSSRSVRTNLVSWLEHFPVSEAPISWYIASRMLRDDSLSQKVNQSPEVTATIKQAARDILDRNEQNKHNAALPKISTSSDSNFEIIWSTPKVAEDLLLTLYNRSSADIEKQGLLKHLASNSALQKNLSSQCLALLSVLPTMPSWLPQQLRGLSDQDYLTLLTTQLSLLKAPMPIAPLKQINTEFKSRPKLRKAIINHAFGTGHTELTSVLIASLPASEALDYIDLYSILVNTTTHDLRCLQIRGLIALNQSNDPLIVKSSKKLWSELIRYKESKGFDGFKSESEEVQQYFTKHFGDLFIWRGDFSYKPHKETVEVIIKHFDILTLFHNPRFMDYVFSADTQAQTSIANALDNADTQVAQAIYKSIYLRITTEASTEAIDFGIYLVRNHRTFFETIKNDIEKSKIIKQILKSVKNRLTAFLLEILARLDLTSDEQIQLLCYNNITDDITLADLRNSLLQPLVSADAVSFFSRALESFKSKRSPSALQKKQVTHFVSIFEAISETLSLESDIEKIASGTLLADMAAGQADGFLYSMFGSNNELRQIGIALLPFTPNAYFLTENYVKNIYNTAFPGVSRDQDFFPSWVHTLSLLSKRSAIAQVWLTEGLDYLQSQRFTGSQYTSNHQLNSFIDQIQTPFEELSKAFAKADHQAHYTLIQQCSGSAHDHIRKLGLSFFKHFNYKHFNNAAFLITEAVLNTNDTYCQAGIDILKSILLKDEKFGIEILIECLSHWMKNPQQYGTAYTPGAHFYNFFKDINNQLITKLTLEDNRILETGLKLLEIGANYGVLISKKLLHNLDGHQLLVNKSKFIHLLYDYNYQSTQIARDLLKKALSRLSQDPQARIELLIELTNHPDYRKKNRVPIGEIARDLFQNDIESNIHETKIRAHFIGLLSKESVIAQSVLHALQSVDTEILFQSNTLMTFLTQAPWAITEAHAILNKLFNADPSFEQIWLKQAYYKLYQTTHADAVFGYLHPLLMQNIQDLQSIIQEDAKAFYKQLNHLIGQSLKINDSKLQADLTQLISKIIVSSDTAELVNHHSETLLLLLDHKLEPYRSQSLSLLTTISHQDRAVLTRLVLTRMPQAARFDNWATLILSLNYQSTLKDVILGEQELGFNVLTSLLLSNSKNIISHERKKLAEAIRTQLTDETLITKPSALLSLSMHAGTESRFYQDKVKHFSAINRAFSQKLLPLLVKACSQELKSPHDILIHLPTTQGLENLSANREDNQPLPKGLRWNNIYYANQEGFQSHPNNIGFDVTIAGKTYNKIFLSTHGTVMLTDAIDYQRWEVSNVNALYETTAKGLIIAPWFTPARTSPKGSVQSSTKNNTLYVKWDISPKETQTSTAELPKVSFAISIDSNNNTIRFHYLSCEKPKEPVSLVDAACAIIETNQTERTAINMFNQMGLTSKGNALDVIKDNPVGPKPHYASYLMGLLEGYPPSSLKDLSIDTWTMCFESNHTGYLDLMSKIQPDVQNLSNQQLLKLVMVDHPDAKSWIDATIESQSLTRLGMLETDFIKLLNHQEDIISSRAIQIFRRLTVHDSSKIEKVLDFILNSAFSSKKDNLHPLAQHLMVSLDQKTTFKMRKTLAKELKNPNTMIGHAICIHLSGLLRQDLSVGIWMWNSFLSRAQRDSIAPQCRSMFEDYLESIKKQVHQAVSSATPAEIEDTSWWSVGLETDWDIAKTFYPLLKALCKQNIEKTLLLSSGLLSSPKPGQLMLRWIEELPIKHSADYAVVLVRAWRHSDITIRETALKMIEGTLLNDSVARQTFANSIVPSLTKSERWPGHHQSWLESLRSTLKNIEQDYTPISIWRLLRAPNLNVQRYAIGLMKDHITPDAISIAKLVDLADSDCFEIRQFVWDSYSNSISRMKSNMGESLKLLESTWEDSRQFAFDYFSKFTEEDWKLNELIRICDSTRADVQAFGQELLTKFMDTNEANLMLRRLSQHPDISVERYVSQRLTEDLLQNLELLQHLIPYFKRVLARVNAARSARNNVVSAIIEAALHSKEGAILLMPIIRWLANIHVKSDQQKAITLMINIKDKFPSIPNPIQY